MAEGASKSAVEVTCAACGRAFVPLRNRKGKYCSQECYQATRAKNRRVTACPECGKEFTWYAAWPRKYCSNECKGKATVSNIKRFAPSAYTAKCEVCSQEFTTTPNGGNRGRFCSQACWGKWLSMYKRDLMHPRTGRKFGRSPHLPPPVYKDCVVCGTPFLTKQSHLERRLCCSKDCYSVVLAARISGENNWNWVGGYEPYYGPTWASARRAARERDKVCQDCGISPEELGRELDVHHIRRFGDFGRERHEEANRLDNLVALCNTCHTKRDAATRMSTAR